MAFDTADRSRDPSRIEPISPGQRRSPAESLPIGRHYPSWRRCRPAAWAPLAGGWPRRDFAQVQSSGGRSTTEARHRRPQTALKLRA
jgi:hypothetical protein